jgi:hypothetical protein
MECAASLDVMRLRKLITDTRYKPGPAASQRRGRDVDQDAVNVNA